MTSGRGTQTALITGASSGIGYELTRLFARDGYSLVLVARSEQRLHEIAADLQRQHGSSVQVLARDLALANAAQAICDELQAQRVQVDVLVNNAGYTIYGAFAETEWQRLADMMQVNMVALTQLTRLLLPGMLARRSGRILNLASTAAFQAGPLMSVYYASKAYVLLFSEGLASELEGTGVTVTVLAPGATESGFQARGGMDGVRLVERSLPSAQAVAAAGYRAMMRGETLHVPGLGNRLGVLATRLIPRRLATQMVRLMHQRRG